MWTVPREWSGTAFIIAGGPSVLEQDLSPLAGRRVIAINSAWHTWRKADVLFFADARWWTEYRPKPDRFSGLVVTTSHIVHPDVKRLNKVEPFAMSLDRGCVALRRSSVTGAINLALHFGAEKIVLLGVDGKLGADGRRHSHGVKYKWALRPKCFDEHNVEFRKVAASIPVPVFNCSPVSTIDAWPKMKFEDCL